MANKPPTYNGPPPTIRDPKTGRMQKNPEYATWKAAQDKAAEEQKLADAQAKKAKADAQAAKITEQQRKAQEKAAKAQERQNKADQKAADQATKQAAKADADAKKAELQGTPDANGIYPGQPGYDKYAGLWGTANDPRINKNSTADNSAEALARRTEEMKKKRAGNFFEGGTPVTPLKSLSERLAQKGWAQTLALQAAAAEKTGDHLKRAYELEVKTGENEEKAAQAAHEASEHHLKNVEDMSIDDIRKLKAQHQQKKKDEADREWYKGFKEHEEVEEYMKAGHGIRMALGKSMLSGINRLGGDKLSAKGLTGFSKLIMGDIGTKALIESEEGKGEKKANKAVIKMAEANEKTNKHLEHMEHENKEHHEKMEHLELEHLLSLEGLLEITKKGFEKIMPKPSITNRLMWAGGLGLFSGVLNRKDDNNFFGSMLKGLLGDDNMAAVDKFVSPIEEAVGINDKNRKTITQGTSLGMLGSLFGLTPGVLGGHAVGAVGDMLGGNLGGGLLKLLPLLGGGMLAGKVAGSDDPIGAIKTTFTDFKEWFMKKMDSVLFVMRKMFNAMSIVAVAVGKAFGMTDAVKGMGTFEDNGDFKPILDKDGNSQTFKGEGFLSKALAGAGNWAVDHPIWAFSILTALKELGPSVAVGLIQGIISGRMAAKAAGAAVTAASGAVAGAAEGAVTGAAGAAATGIAGTVLSVMGIIGGMGLAAGGLITLFGVAGDYWQGWLNKQDWYRESIEKAKVERKEEKDTGQELFGNQMKLNVLSNPDAKSLARRVQQFNMANPDNQITPEDIESYKTSKTLPTKKFNDPNFTMVPPSFEAAKAPVVNVNNIKQGDNVYGSLRGASGASPGVGSAVAPTNLWDRHNWGMPYGVR